LSSTISTGSRTTTDIPYDSFNVVSIQSTARPGCIIELENVADSNGHWVKSDLFHIYQEGLIRNVKKKAKLDPAQQDATSSFANGASPNHVFNETYFLVLLEKHRLAATKRIVEKVHMWQVNIKSSLFSDEKNNIDEKNGAPASDKNRLSITSMRVCNQELPLPEGVHIVCAETAAADLAASAMFSINRVPYLFATACSDGIVRFWSVKELTDAPEGENSYEFHEWEMNASSPNSSGSSQVKIGPTPLDLSCSYNSRFAVAYKKTNEVVNAIQITDYSGSGSQTPNNPPASQTNTFADYCVKIYECESTGGSEWKLEECINLNSIVLPELDSGINFDYIFGGEKPIKPSRSMHSFKTIVFGNNSNNSGQSGGISQQTASPSSQLINSPSLTFMPTMSEQSSKFMQQQQQPYSEIPSTAAKMSIKRKFSSVNTPHAASPFNKLGAKKKAINLDWGSTENGSHILTIGLGNRIFVYSCVSRDLAKEKFGSSKM
jgi:hypothetical protein